jgi:hypothetical protein
MGSYLIIFKGGLYFNRFFLFLISMIVNPKIHPNNFWESFLIFNK